MSPGALALDPAAPARRRPTAAVLGLVFLLLAGVGVLLLRGGSETAVGSAHGADSAELSALSRQLDQPIFWAGPANPGSSLELTEAADGSVFVRYLPDGGAPGDSRERFTTVATYSVPDAYAALQNQARRASVVSRDLPAGGLATLDARRPNSVHIAWPDSGYEVELFDPSPRRALELVLDGAIAPIR
jgi:hypothetical protein